MDICKSKVLHCTSFTERTNEALIVRIVVDMKPCNGVATAIDGADVFDVVLIGDIFITGSQQPCRKDGK